MASDCKYLVEFAGASHCHFDEIPNDRLGPIADAACVAVEGRMCKMENNTVKAISMQRQEQLTVEYVLPWLEWTLHGNTKALTAFTARARGDAANGSVVLKANVDACPEPNDHLQGRWVV